MCRFIEFLTSFLEYFEVVSEFTYEVFKHFKCLSAHSLENPCQDLFPNSTHCFYCLVKVLGSRSYNQNETCKTLKYYKTTSIII